MSERGDVTRFYSLLLAPDPVQGPARVLLGNLPHRARAARAGLGFRRPHGAARARATTLARLVTGRIAGGAGSTRPGVVPRKKSQDRNLSGPGQGPSGGPQKPGESLSGGV